MRHSPDDPHRRAEDPIARHNRLSSTISEDAYRLEVEDDYLSPFLNPGDFVLVDPADDRLADGIVCFEFRPGVPIIRRVQLTPDGLRVFGDNCDYGESMISTERARLALMGRVRYMWKRV